jgi:hypothetical protein
MSAPTDTTNLLGTNYETTSLLVTALVPLFQTILWVGLIVWLVHRYNSQVTAVLTAIKARIERGSPFKFGMLELGQDIRPQGVQEQNKRMEEEVQQLQATTVQSIGAQSPEALRRFNVSLKQKYLLAEDLVMRELQSEFGTAINRSVRLGGVELDGIFGKEGRGFGVEVKFFTTRIATERLFPSLSRIEGSLQRLGWKNFTILLALVCENDEPVSPSVIERIQTHASEMGTTVMVRVYTLKALAAKFGIELHQADKG